MRVERIADAPLGMTIEEKKRSATAHLKARPFETQNIY